jgi:biopolymer transport protein ExbD
MNLRPERREDPEVNLTPLIDVVFLLLIFFMVSTTFDREARLKIELPEATSEVTEAPAEVLEIAINAAGDFFIDEQKLVNRKPETLKKAIQQTLGERRDLPVIIRADGRTPHQSVVTVMDTASQLGLLELSLATVHTDDNE